MQEKRISFFNKMEVCGYVENFDIKTFPSGTKLANLRIKDTLTNNVTYVQIFDRQNGISYGGKNYTLEGLKSIFIDSTGKARGICIAVKGKARETYSNTTGTTKVYTNFTAFQIDESTQDKQRAILIANGIVENVSRTVVNDEDVTKIKIGMCNTDKDKNINGIDYITVVARDKNVEKLEDVLVGDAIGVQCDILNRLPEQDRFGNFIGGQTQKEILIANVVYVNESDELNETDVKNYKLSKTLEKGTVIKVSRDSDANIEVAEEHTTPKKELSFDIMDDDLDF